MTIYTGNNDNIWFIIPTVCLDLNELYEIELCFAWLNWQLTFACIKK